MRKSPAAKLTHYSALQLEPSATEGEIRSAYLKLIREHRERPRERDLARTERARQINLAYATLGNPNERRAYDSSLGLKPAMTAEAEANGQVAHAAAAPSADEGELLQAPLTGEEPATAGPETQSSAIPLHSDPAPSATAEPTADVPPADAHDTVPVQDRTSSYAPMAVAYAARPSHEATSNGEVDALLEPSASESGEAEDGSDMAPDNGWDERDSMQAAAHRSEPADTDGRRTLAGHQGFGPTSTALGLAAVLVAGGLLLFAPAGTSVEEARRPSDVAGVSSSGFVNSPQPSDLAGGSEGSLEPVEEPVPEVAELASEQIAADASASVEPAAAAEMGNEATANSKASSDDRSPSRTLEPASTAIPATAPSIPARPQGPSRASPATWVSGGLFDADNPQGRFVGTVDVRFTVLPSGRVEGCTPVGSSGDAALDAITCRLAEQRLRFNPATNGEGRPVASEVRTSYTWGRRSRR